MPDETPPTPGEVPPVSGETPPAPETPPSAPGEPERRPESGPPASAGFDRRSFLKGAALTAGAAGVAAWGVSPWIGDLFHRRGSYVYPSRPPTWPAVATAYSVCK